MGEDVEKVFSTLKDKASKFDKEVLLNAILYAIAHRKGADGRE